MHIQPRRTLVKGLLVIIAVIGLSNIAHAELVLTAPPRENAENGMKVYGPLAEKLSTVLGERVIYEQPHGWFDYARNMRDGKYDIVFDGPHFAAWRVKNLHHIPIVTLPGTLNFVLITRMEFKSINTLRDLAGKKICGLLSPNLGTNLIYNSFANPVLQPQIFEIKGNMQDVYNAFKQGKCTAAVLRDPTFYGLAESERAQLKILLKTRPLPNQTLTVSTRLKDSASKIANFMLSKDGAIAADGILSRFSKKQKHFEKASVAKYNGIEDLLEGVVFGW